MGKSKAKKAQRYSTPSDKYLIVTDPWGGVPMQDHNFFNNVTAWFEIMLKSKHPGVRPSAIYYQWTNKNIVVELPDHVDVESFLGAHYWKYFLVPPHCFNVAERASYVYEFDYKNHHIPPVQGGWTPGYASYSKIRPDFDVRDPYPPSRPARNSPLAFAKKLPPTRLLLPGQEDLPPLPPLPLGLPELPMLALPDFEGLEDKEVGSSSPGGALSGADWRDDSRGLTMDRTDGEREREYSTGPSETLASTRSPQTILTTHIVATRDSRQSQTTRESHSPTNACPDGSIFAYTTQYQPYSPPGHLTEAAEAFLTSLTPSSNSEPSASTSKAKMGKKMDPYEQEEHAMEFLRRSSTVNAATATMTTTTITTASSPPTRTVSIKAEVEVKEEPFDYDQPPDDSNVRYMPSEELQAAFASLVQPCYEGDVEARIKEEPEEVDEYTPSQDLLRALASLPSEMVDLSHTATGSVDQGDRWGNEVRVKDEPRDDDDNGPVRPTEQFRFKREPESPDREAFTKRVKLER